jgi:hypothetical protein
MGRKIEDDGDLVRVIPSSGKYCELQFEGKNYKIWKVLPGSDDNGKGEFGTLIPRDVAIEFLSRSTQLIMAIPVGGKFPFNEEELELIKGKRSVGVRVTYTNYNQEMVSAGSGVDDKALTEALRLVARQADENKKLAASQADLLARLAKLESAGVSGGGSSKESKAG